jgi:hypothetical protein
MRLGSLFTMASVLPFAAAWLVLAGCSDDAAVAIDPGPTGPPSVKFSDPAPGDAPICVSVGEDADTRVPLLIAIEELELRPPGGCEGVAQCGRLALYANGVFNNETAVRAVDLLVYKLGNPYHDGSVHEGTGEADLLELRVEVLTDESEVLLDHDGEPLSDSIQLITVADCAAM